MRDLKEKHSSYTRRTPILSVGSQIEVSVNGERYHWEIVEEGKSDITEGKISSRSELIKLILTYLWARERGRKR